MPDPAPLGILGGAFDPVHNAHLALARAALERFGLAQVRWIPAGRPWHRGALGASPADRVAMVQAAIAAEPRFVLDASEAEAGAPGYTVDTLLRLRRELGAKTPLWLLMGADAYAGLRSWHRWEEIFGLAQIAVATRPGHPPAVQVAGVHPFELAAGTVSATEVRALLAAGAPDAQLLELLPAPVLDYIRRHSLYTG